MNTVQRPGHSWQIATALHSLVVLYTSYPESDLASSASLTGRRIKLWGNFSPKSTGAHPDLTCEHVHDCKTLRVQSSSPHQFGCSRGGEGWAAPPAQCWSKTTTGSLCSHLYSAQSHLNCSVNAGQQLVEGEILTVCLISLFLIHYTTAL